MLTLSKNHPSRLCCFEWCAKLIEEWEQEKKMVIKTSNPVWRKTLKQEAKGRKSSWFEVRALSEYMYNRNSISGTALSGRKHISRRFSVRNPAKRTTFCL
jgi:hypothetical protein